MSEKTTTKPTTEEAKPVQVGSTSAHTTGTAASQGRGPYATGKDYHSPHSETGKEEAEGRDIARFNEQCYLVDNFRKYATIKPAGYKHFVCIDGEPTTFVQKLLARKGLESFMDLTAAQLALLVPLIRIFRVPMKASQTKASGPMQEVVFKTFYKEETVRDMLTSRAGDAVGLKGLSYELEQGGSMELSGNRQLVTLTFVAESMHALSKKHGGKKGVSGVSVLDLARDVNRYNKVLDSHGNITEKPNSNYFAVRLVYGWAVPKNLPKGSEKLFPMNIRKAIKRANRTLILNKMIDKLTFNRDGSVELEIEYNGYIDAAMSVGDKDVLRSDENRKKATTAVSAMRIQNSKMGALENRVKAQADILAQTDYEGANVFSDQGVKLQNAYGKLDEAAREEADKSIRAWEKTNQRDLGDKDDVRYARYKLATSSARATALAALKKAEAALQDKREKNRADPNYVTRADAQDIYANDMGFKHGSLLKLLIEQNRFYEIPVKPSALGLEYKKATTSSGDGGSKTTTTTTVTAYKDKNKAATQKELDAMTPPQRAAYEKKVADQGGAKTAAGKQVTENEEGDNTVANKLSKTQDLAQATALSTAKSTESISGASETTDTAKKEKRKLKGTVDNQSKESVAPTRTVTDAQGDQQDMVIINYFHWGDLFAAALQSAYAASVKDMPKFLVGGLKFQDMRTRKWRTINLADVPISLNLFQVWWVKKVIAPQLEQYSIKQFITDSIQELILPALGSACWGGGKNFGKLGIGGHLSPPRVAWTVVDAQAGAKGADRLGQKRRIDVNQDIPDPGSIEHVGAERHIEYVYIYCDAWSETGLDKNRSADTMRGIYHITIGEDRGPIKSISFSADEDLTEGMRTSAALNPETAGMYNVTYTADLSMIGNNLFMPGNLLYIAPRGFGATADPASKVALGLGGYYIIGEMSGKVDSTGWTVDAHCIPQGPGRKGATSAPVVATKDGNDPEKPVKT